MKLLLSFVILLTAGLQAGSAKSVKTRKAKEAGWYMRTRIAATTPDGTVYAHNSAGVFGELRQSRNEYDRHDIPAYGPAVLQVVFPHYHWGTEHSGDYWSDYRKYNPKKPHQRRVWTFLVRNQKGVDLSQAALKIRLDDAEKVRSVKERGYIRYIESGTDVKMKERFTLVDVDHNETYSVDELPYTDFAMDGKHTRTFRWVRGPVKKKDFKPVTLSD